MASVISLWVYVMNSIRHLLTSQIFKAILAIFLSMTFFLNIAFYLLSNSQFQNEIERQYQALYLMTSHLASEEDSNTLVIYLEHYTHTNDVILSYQNHDHEYVFTNDDSGFLTQFESVYYEDELVGYLAVNFETSKLGKDMLYGFIGLNLISMILLLMGMSILYRFLKLENIKISRDLKSIDIESTQFSYREVAQIHDHLIANQKQKDRQKMIYESHIKHLAHDIKTPLTVIQIHIDSLINDKVSSTHEIMSDMQEEIKKISDIIPKFIEHDYIHVPYVQDISIFIKHYVEKYKEIFESKQMKIEYELEPLMLNISDRDLERLIEHLTFNAFYYSKQQSTLKMTVRRTECKLEVQDEGIGMTQETIEKILEGPYRTQEAMLMNEKGSGIGFQNIKEVVSKLRGRMQIESIIGQGTKISIFFDEKLIA